MCVASGTARSEEDNTKRAEMNNEMDLKRPKMKTRVTIGICARNAAGILSSAIESIVRQDFPHESMEIIFVDDGSEDKTVEVMQEYASKTDIVTRIFSGEWRGLGKARNTVVANAEGDYIIWVDSDETIERDFVRKQINFIERNPRAGIVTGRLGILPKENPVLVLDLIPNVIAYSNPAWEDLSKLPGTGGATYRVAAAREVGGFDDRLKGTGEDVDIACRIKQAGWLILGSDGVFFESHGMLGSWRELWERYFNHGIHNRRLYGKSGKFFSILRMSPFASFLAGFRYTLAGYRITKLKIAFLLTVHYTFKMTAWFYGFTKG